LVEIRILGPLELVEDGRPVVMSAPKVRALLAVLVLHRGEVVSTDRLIDALWGERASPTAPKTVQVYVSNLRKALDDGLLVTHGHGYVLQVEPGQLDVDRFEALVAEGRRAREQGDSLTAAALLREAEGVWRGPALADFAYEPFAQSEIARLEESRLAALEDRIDADLALGKDARLVGELEALVREHPVRERLCEQLMLALYRSGRQADALQAYRDARRQLLDELGLEPGRALQELEQAILIHDPALEAPGRPASRRAPATAKRSWRGGVLIAAGGALLLAVIGAVAVKLASSGAPTVQVAPNSVAEIDGRSGRVVRATPVGVRPGPIAFGSGSLWIANLDDQTIQRVDPKSLRTLVTIPLSAPPTGLAASGDGVWVVEPNANPTQSSVLVSRIDPDYNVPGPPVHIGNVVPDGPGSVAAQGDAVWVAPSNGLLTRLDALTGAVRGQVDPNASPSGIAVGEGAVWLTDGEPDSETNNVIRVDPTGLLKSIPVGNGPSAIATGDGAVWVIDALDETVVRMDPDTASVTNTIPVGHSPAGVAVGDGSVWVANSGDGTVTRINPTTDKPVTIRVGGSPQALTVAAGRVYVTVDARSIAPSPPGSPDGTLRMVSFNDVDSIDPALAATEFSLPLIYPTCAGLLNYPDKPGAAGSQLTPDVAQSLPTRSPDRRTYTFTIRRGFRFAPPSNQPVTAQTFKQSIERTLSPKMNSFYASDMTDIVGERRYLAGERPHIPGVVAQGNRLTIRLIAPSGDFLSRIACPANEPLVMKGSGVRHLRHGPRRTLHQAPPPVMIGWPGPAPDRGPGLLSRWMRRGFAIAIVYIGLLLVPIGLGLVVVPPVVTQVNHFVDDAPRYAADVRDFIEHNRTLHRLQEEYDIGGQLQKKAAELPAKFGSAASLLAGLGLGLLNSVFAAVTILVLAAFMLASGPRWREEALRMLPAERAAAWRQVSDDIAGAVGNYVGGAIAQAVIAGTSSYVVMLILGIPFSGPLAVLIGVLDLIPLVGATIGAVLVGIVSVLVGFPLATIIWGVWAIVYQQVENNLIQPRIQARAVDVQPFIVLVAVLFGGVLFGILGALMAAPAAASAQIVIRELLRQRRALRTEVDGDERSVGHEPDHGHTRV
jgi:YVTN family beta-propeller protein